MKNFDISTSMNDNLKQLEKFDEKLVVKTASDNSNRIIMKNLLKTYKNLQKLNKQAFAQEVALVALSVAEESNENFDDLFEMYGLTN